MAYNTLRDHDTADRTTKETILLPAHQVVLLRSPSSRVEDAPSHFSHVTHSPRSGFQDISQQAVQHQVVMHLSMDAPYLMSKESTIGENSGDKVRWIEEKKARARG